LEQAVGYSCGAGEQERKKEVKKAEEGGRSLKKIQSCKSAMRAKE